jgi:hypothetical protein
LFAAESVDAALTEVMARVEKTKRKHGAPAGNAGILRKAAKTAAASDGLKQVMALLDRHADPAVVAPLQARRDQMRKFYGERNKTASESALVSPPVN